VDIADDDGTRLLHRVRSLKAGLAVFAALVLLTPAGIALQAWRMRVPSGHAALAALVGAGVTTIAIFLTVSYWWSGHDRMT
jgi:hypothetical protein